MSDTTLPHDAITALVGYEISQALLGWFKANPELDSLEGKGAAATAWVSALMHIASLLNRRDGQVRASHILAATTHLSERMGLTRAQVTISVIE